MRLSQLILSSLLFIGSSKGFAAFDAHEWGTFTSLVGSNGITQNGMYHEDEPLPDFVHSFGELRLEAALPPTPSPQPTPPRCPRRSKLCFDQAFLSQNIVTQKMETPVIYFYTDR